MHPGGDHPLVQPSNGRVQVKPFCLGGYMKQFYVYLHLKPNGDPFYVGKGSGSRCFEFYKRGKHHKSIVAKYGKRNIEVLTFMRDTEDAAFASEVCWIKALQCAGYLLANKTLGGEGGCGLVWSDEMRQRASVAAKKRVLEHPGLLEKLWANARGKSFSIEHKEKLSERKKGRSLPESQRVKIGLAHKGKVTPDATKKKMSDAAMGKRKSESAKANMSIGQQRRFSK